MAVITAPSPARLITDANRGLTRHGMKSPAGVAFTPATLAPAPVAAVLKGGIVGTAYAETISGVNGRSPYTFSLIGGTLPSGCTLNGSTGVISGTLTTAGTYTFTIKVTDASSITGTQAFTITVAAPSGGGGSFVFVS